MSSSTLIEPALGYSERLAERIEALLAGPPTELVEFLGELGGADPAIAIAILEARHAGDANARRLSEEARCRSAPLRTPAPIGHPLDYAWLFTPETRKRLLRRVAEHAPPGDLVVHLGCPTLHQQCLADLPDRRHLLFDRDPRRVQSANAQRPGSARLLDLCRDPIEELGAGLILADPPWYPGETAAFLNAAAIFARPGAEVLLAFAAEMTRPGIPHELESILAMARGDGLLLTEVSHGLCTYQAPSFELAAFSAAGLGGIPPQWRRADLYRLRRTTTLRPERRLHLDSIWRAVEIDEVPFRVRRDAPTLGSELIGPLVEGDILPSVSRRDPRRGQAALWSSCNRIFASCDPGALEQAALDAERGASGQQVVRQLRRLAALERSELGLA